MVFSPSPSAPPTDRGAFRVLRLAVFLVAILTPACNQRADESVTAYDTAKPDPEPRGKNRMLAVIRAEGDKWWYLKLVGPTPFVDPHEKEFDAFVQSFRFTDEGKPTWTVPPSWTKMPDDESRYAAFHVGPADDDVELTVNVLPAPASDKHLIDVINRWRGQLRRLPVGEDDARVFTTKLELNGKTIGYRVDLTGNGPGRIVQTAAPAPAERATPRRSFEFTKPADWVETQEKAAMGIPREATFRVPGEGGESARVTVHIMEKTDSLLANVNRWGKEVGLPKMTEEQMVPLIRGVTVDGIPGTAVDLTGPEGDRRLRSLVVMVERKQRFWFFKMMGSAELVGRQKAAFEDFVKSVKFEGGR